MGGMWWSRTCLVLCVAALVACGGGGGGGGSGAAVAANGPASTDGTVVIQGIATFDSVPNASNGRLDYGAVSAKPIRGALVEAVTDNGSRVLTSGTTSETGAYALSVPVNATVQIRVRAQLQRSGAPSWDVTVRDNTGGGTPVYAISSSEFSSGGSATLQRSIHAPSGWGGASYTGERAAGPFALLDTVYTNIGKVLSVAPTASFPALSVFWSVKNTNAFGDRASGQIGTTFFTTSTSGERAIYVLGKADVDTDEYDVSVVSHEWGHYYQSVFSRDDSPGGSHSGSDLLDRRLAFSEGWGNAWSGIALGRSTYTDSLDAGQAGGGALDLSTGPATNPGWFREFSIQSIFWNLERAAGFAAIHSTMTGPFKTGLAVTSIHPFAVAFTNAAPAQTGTLVSLLAGQSISTSTTDPFGESETNDGDIDKATPLYLSYPSPPTSVCVTNEAGSGNKLGRFAYLRFSLVNAGMHRITVVAVNPSGTNPSFEIYRGGWIGDSNKAVADVEDATLNLPAGESVLVLEDANAPPLPTSGPVTTSCFAVTIN
ncbi:hypothetical protein ACSFA0_22385 [Variovorax sp. LT1P1]|uniref:hypothetical protein n=1 Tax=Variovorax sp. LT1P1 TaxID=3443730 RepID=UPI003F48C006